MGVRGLTTFINKQENKYLKSHKLHNCTVLLDGNSIASNLFFWSNAESAFGGDYDKYAKYVHTFFKTLNKCKISPIVVFDGGYEERKLKTVYSRMKDKFRLSHSAHPLTGPPHFPLFMRTVFREVLSALKIPFAQCDFEADDEIAALARQLECPVLSYDSDYYIYDVLYIPLPSLCLEPTACEEHCCSNGDITTNYYLDCKIYKVDAFIASFGGLDKSMLPLLATLLGNDYVKRSVFKYFYMNLKIPKGKTNPLQRRIKAVIEWLRNETFETAMEKILVRMKLSKRRHVMMQMRIIVKGYTQCFSKLSEHLITSDCKTTEESLKKESYIVKIIDKISENVESIGEEILLAGLEKIDNGGVSNSETSSVASDEGFDNESNNASENMLECRSNTVFSRDCSYLPNWLLDYFRKGNIQSCVMDITSLNQYFLVPQVEDFDLPSAHLISMKILGVVVGLLLGADGKVKCWIRNGTLLDFYYVEPIVETFNLKLPEIDKVFQIEESTRKKMLLHIAESSVELCKLPEDWHLFTLAIIFWLKNMKSPVANECHLFTIILCFVCIYTFDLHLGVHRNKQTFMKKYKKYLHKLLDKRSKEDKDNKESCSSTLPGMSTSCEEQMSDPKAYFYQVNHEDCVIMFETIVPYHHLSNQIKNNPKTFCLATVHAFSQFQSVLFHLMLLNSLLGFPLKEPIVSRLFSGTFVYNMFTNLTKRNNIDAYIETLFLYCPTLLRLYKVLLTYLQSALVDTDLYKKPPKKQRKKKKGHQHVKLEECATSQEEEYDGLFTDENNRFSALLLQSGTC